jgi:hypothetical protein
MPPTPSGPRLMLIATATGVYFLDSGGSWPAPAARFKGKAIRQIAEASHLGVVALADSHLMILSEKGSRLMTTALRDPVTSLLILEADPLHLLIGTEDTRLYRITGGRGPAERVTSFDAPTEGARRPLAYSRPRAAPSLAASPDGWIYADISLGGILRSPDRGITWETAMCPDFNEDVHQVAVCPAAPDRLYANTDRSVFVSDDRGRSWHARPTSSAARYGRALAVSPRDPDLLLATESDGPHGDEVHARLLISRDAGRCWHPVGGAFPASSPAQIDTFHIALTEEGSGWAVLGRTLYVGRDAAADWRVAWESPEPIRMISCHA